MSSSLLKKSSARSQVAPLSPWGALPQAVRALYITTPSCPAVWLRELLEADRAVSVTIEECLGNKAALTRLREATFDVLVVQHVPDELDAVEFVEAHRATGADDPLVVLAQQPEPELAPLCYEVGADACLDCGPTNARQLIWAIGRAIQWRRLLAENRRLIDRERNRHRLEHCEAERLLDQQRGLVSGLEELAHSTDIDAKASIGSPLAHSAAIVCAPVEVPSSLVARYRDLLRAHVIMGSGNLAAETTALVDALVRLDTPATRVMQLHVHVLEETLRGLGGRSSRHVMARADLLVLEIMAQLAERYRQRV